MTINRPIVWLYSRPPGLLSSLKNGAKFFLKKLLGFHQGGPQAVLKSIVGGMSKINVVLKLNQKLSHPVRTIWAVSGTNTLRWAISMKKAGRCESVVAGPNIVVFPDDDNAVLKNAAIDIVVVPSEWVRRAYGEGGIEEKKMLVWPAGVSLPEVLPRERNNKILIFQKNAPETLVQGIKDQLKHAGFGCDVIRYGAFKPATYLGHLRQASYMVYLSTSESQGIALLEAWGHNVPTLVWNPQKHEHKGRVMSGVSSAPYLTSERGVFFRDIDEFTLVLSTLKQYSFAPNASVKDSLSDAQTAQNILSYVAS